MSSVNDNAPSPLPADGVSKRKQGKRLQFPLSAWSLFILICDLFLFSVIGYFSAIRLADG
jgi:hypothetical protein